MSAFVEHGLCSHKSDDIKVALALALSCTQVAASRADEAAILTSFHAGEPVWYGGHLLIGGEK